MRAQYIGNESSEWHQINKVGRNAIHCLMVSGSETYCQEVDYDRSLMVMSQWATENPTDE